MREGKELDDRTGEHDERVVEVEKDEGALVEQSSEHHPRLYEIVLRSRHSSQDHRKQAQRHRAQLVITLKWIFGCK